MEIPDGDTLYGLYQGTPLTERQWSQEPRVPDKVSIYQRPIEEDAESEDDIVVDRRRDRHPRVRPLLRPERGRDRGDRRALLARRRRARRVSRHGRDKPRVPEPARSTREREARREARHAIPNAPHAEARPKHRARKRFGQHFLERAWAAKLVTRPRAVAPDDVFVEIGPGRGALTRPLAAIGRAHPRHRRRPRPRRRARRVGAADADRSSPATSSPSTTPACCRRATARVRVVGNLPYNLSSPILFRVLALARATDRVRDATVMLQREVADRVARRPGQRRLRPAGVMLGLFADRARGPRRCRRAPSGRRRRSTRRSFA